MTMNKPISSLQDIEKLFELMKEYKIDFIEIEGVKVQKRIHEQPPRDLKDDENLFQS
jgi:hypothetical protein